MATCSEKRWPLAIALAGTTTSLPGSCRQRAVTPSTLTRLTMRWLRSSEKLSSLRVAVICRIACPSTQCALGSTSSFTS